MVRIQAVEHSFADRPDLVGADRFAASGGAEHGRAADTADRVDADVVDAVLHCARTVLAERVARAAEIDPLFAADVAGRVADFTLDGGKLVRPRLLWWAMRACGGADAAAAGAALRLGVALELIQSCALMHDDVMDRSQLRRGRPAAHIALATGAGLSPESERGAAFGASAAVLAGDLALVWADDTVAETDLDPAARRRVAAVWRSMRTEMVAGQYLDLHGQATGGGSAARAIRTACLKSALYSVERPLAIGAALAGAGGRTTATLRSAGRAAGIAFQLRDDLLGVFGDPGRTGKPSGDDIREGKPTYLLAVARARSAATGDGAALALLDRAVGDRELTEDGLTRVREVFEASGARALVERKADRLGDRAVLRLARAVDVEEHAGGQLLGLLRTVAGGAARDGSAARGHGGPSSARVRSADEGGGGR
ncbi:Farnesyl diphosphate synthase [Streptomyces sp. ADI96-02]|uniref:polyprenyl synthetase family protein n=1 Tax=Streptomyces sp. ADI96-02 TaxID=1522760 RepID=UPI000F550ABD|nr:polyprenyl synthetase family protein [Streptomyces sp. ADI96-02]RPK54249.1 Farnesyl diphosphate synthase [Streptomyces sp. ADI96-02]